MQRQHFRIAVLACQFICLLDRLLRLDCEFVPTNCHNVLLKISCERKPCAQDSAWPPNLLERSLTSSVSALLPLRFIGRAAKTKREMKFSSPVGLTSSSSGLLHAAYPWRVFWPIPTLICRGLASARLASVIFKTPLS